MNTSVQLIPSRSLILTKLQPPLVRCSILPRERLAALVRSAADRRLTLVCAGAGYGKTTLVADSLDRSSRAVVWYSLSRSDNDLITFLSYLSAALDGESPGFSKALCSIMDPSQLAPLAFVSAFVNQLTAMATRDLILVFDDFQLVEQTCSIHDFLDQLILHAPPQVHFVIATRSAPEFSSLPRLRAEGQAIEIGEADLRFSTEEAAALFDRSFELYLDDHETRAITEPIEGWALGLLMAGQTLHTAGHSPALPGNAADRRVLFAYLSEEVIRQQPPDLVDFLVCSSILSRLEPSVCDAALGRVDSAKHIRRLERHCLFVIPTPDGFLRYHRLFREFLLQQLANDQARALALHRRAATYFEEQKDPETAIVHWLACGDCRQAARLILALSEEMLRAGRLDTLSYWFGKLSADVFDEFPELLVRQGQICEAHGEWDHALEYYERGAEAYTARGDWLGLSEVLRSKGHVLDWRKGEHIEAERLHREALSYVGDEYRRQRAALLSSLSRDQLSAGNTSAARTLYNEAMTLHGSDRLGQLDTLLNPGSWLFHSLGDYAQAVSVLRRAEQLALELGNKWHLAETYNNLSVNLYFMGRYPESLEYAEKALALGREFTDAHQEAYALMNQANAFERTGRTGYADLARQYEHALEIEQALGNRRFTIAILVFWMMLERRRGAPAESIRLSYQAVTLAREHSLRWLAGFVLVQLGAAQICQDADAALGSLEEALQVFSDGGDQYHFMVTRFWLAALSHSENDPAYLSHLRECLEIAVGHHYDEFFCTEIQTAVPLLVSALEHDLWPSYVIPILAKMGVPALAPVRALLSHPRKRVRDYAQSLIKQMGIGPVPLTESHRKPAAAPRLAIRAFGNLAVWRGDELIEERAWGRRKSKRLFKYLVLSPGHRMPKDTAIELIWGDSDPETASANLYRTVYNLRRVLEPSSPNADVNYVAMDGGVLSLGDELISRIDVEEFVCAAEEGRALARGGDCVGASKRLAAAVDLYVGDLSTDDLYDDWLQPRRDQLLHMYLGALNDLGTLAAQSGDLRRAIDYWRTAFQRDNASESVCVDLVRSLIQIGCRSEALQYLDQCERALADLDLIPSAELLAVRAQLSAKSQSPQESGSLLGLLPGTVAKR